MNRKRSLPASLPRLFQRLEDRRLLSADFYTDLPETAYLSRAVPAVTLDATQVIEPVGGSRPTTPGEGRLNIEIIPGQKLRSNLAAMAAVHRAAEQWESHLFDPITVSIEIDFDVTPNGLLGFAIPNEVVPISNVDLRALDLIGYNVLPPNQTPLVPVLADDQAAVGNQDRVVIDILANDRNDGLAFQLSTFQIVEPPLLGDVHFDPVTGLLVYEVQPGRGQDIDAFTYTVANSQGIYGEPAVVEVTIAGAGRVPIAIDDFFLTRENKPSLSIRSATILTTAI